VAAGLLLKNSYLFMRVTDFKDLRALIYFREKLFPASEKLALHLTIV